MRIWHQSMAPLTEFGAYADVLRPHVDAVVAAGTEVVLHGTRRGSYLGRAPATVLRYPYAKHVIQTQAIDACRQAEAEGFDAVALASFGDPFLTECRSVVEIPVTSMVESALMVGCTFAHRLCLVTLTPRSVPRVAEMVARHGLASRVEVTSFAQPVTEADLVPMLAPGADASSLVAEFEKAARRGIDAGADLIVPAEGVLNEVLWSNGVRAAAKAPVMDVIGVVMAYTEMLVRLRAVTGLAPSRLLSYPIPDPELLAALTGQGGER